MTRLVIGFAFAVAAHALYAAAPGQIDVDGTGSPGLGLRGKERFGHPLRPVRRYGPGKTKLKASQQQDYDENRLIHRVRFIHCGSASWRNRYASRLPNPSLPPVQ